MNKTLNECQTHWNKHKSSHGKSSFSLFIFFLFFPSCHSSSSILPPYWYFVSCLALFSLGCHHSLSCRFDYFAPWIFSSFFSLSVCVCVLLRFYLFDSSHESTFSLWSTTKVFTLYFQAVRFFFAETVREKDRLSQIVAKLFLYSADAHTHTYEDHAALLFIPFDFPVRFW